MKRFTLLLLAIAVACVVETPRDSRDDDKSDAGVRDAGGEDAGPGDAGEVDAGDVDGGGTDGGVIAYPRKWGNPVPLTELNSPTEENTGAMSRNMLWVCFMSYRESAKQREIYCASRASTSDPFSAPVNQANINSSGDDHYPIMWNDELYFSSTRANGMGGYDIYHSTWNALAGTYGPPTAVTELNTNKDDEPTGITADGLMLFLHSDRSGTLGALDTWVSTRPSTSSPWGMPINIASLNSNTYDWAMSFAPDESFAIFSSERPRTTPGRFIWLTEPLPGGGWSTPVPADIQTPTPMDVWTAQILTDGSLLAVAQPLGMGPPHLYIFPPRGEDPPPKFQWGTPVAIAELNSAEIEAQATMSADRLLICFISGRSGGVGSFDIWCARRASVNDPFGTPVNQSAINSTDNDWVPALSSDGNELIFLSGRSGTSLLYRATWVPADNAFKFPEPLTTVNSVGGCTNPALTSNDTVLMIDSPLGISMSVRANRTSAFGTPVAVPGLNTSYNENEPGPALDGHSMVFHSDRPGPGEQGKQKNRLWGVEYVNGNWGTPELVVIDGVETDTIADASILSDGSLMFHRDNDLYIALPK